MKDTVCVFNVITQIIRIELPSITYLSKENRVRKHDILL